MTKPRKPINRVSAHQKVKLAEYARLKKQWRYIVTNGTCSVAGCLNPADKSPHHVFGRFGQLLNDTRYWLPVCLQHHRQIHDQPEWARANGLLAPIGQWNNPPQP